MWIVGSHRCRQHRRGHGTLRCRGALRSCGHSILRRRRFGRYGCRLTDRSPGLRAPRFRGCRLGSEPSCRCIIDPPTSVEATSTATSGQSEHHGPDEQSDVASKHEAPVPDINQDGLNCVKGHGRSLLQPDGHSSVMNGRPIAPVSPAKCAKPLRPACDHPPGRPPSARGSPYADVNASRSTLHPR